MNKTSRSSRLVEKRGQVALEITGPRWRGSELQFLAMILRASVVLPSPRL